MREYDRTSLNDNIIADLCAFHNNDVSANPNVISNNNIFRLVSFRKS